MKQLNVCSYCRVSTNKAEQENSLENQKSYFEREIRQRGHIFSGIYADDGLSGTKLDNRADFDKMLTDAGINIIEYYSSKTDKRKSKKHTLYELSDRKPKFDEIWIKNTSRFARNTLSYDIIQKLRQKNVNVYFVEQNINTRDIAQDLLLKLFQIFDEQDSKDKSLKVMTGVKEGIKKGVIHSNSKLYGYKYIKDKNRLEIIPEEAEVIKKIFELYSQGYGIRRIINTLTENMIFTRQGKVFVNNAIRRIIDNEKYAGLNNRGKYDTGIVFSKNAYPKVRDEYMISDTDKIPAIIDKDLFYKCKDILNSKINHVNQRGLYKGISEYSGLIVCGKCGSRYHSNVDNDKRRKIKKEIHFYNCSLRKKQGKQACNNPNITVEQIEAELGMLCSGGYKDSYGKLTKEVNVFILEKIKSSISKRINLDVSEIVSLKSQELDKKIKGLDRITDLYQDFEIEKGEYLQRSKRLKDEIQILEFEISVLGKENFEILEDINNIEKAINEIKDIKLKDHYEKDELLKEISYLEVHTDDKIGVYLFIVFHWMETYVKVIKKYGMKDVEHQVLLEHNRVL